MGSNKKAQLLTWVKKIGKLLLIEEAIAVFVSYFKSPLVSLENLLVAESTVGVVNRTMVWRAGGKEGLGTDRQTNSALFSVYVQEKSILIVMPDYSNGHHVFLDKQNHTLNGAEGGVLVLFPLNRIISILVVIAPHPLSILVHIPA